MPAVTASRQSTSATPHMTLATEASPLGRHSTPARVPFTGPRVRRLPLQRHPAPPFNRAQVLRRGSTSRRRRFNERHSGNPGTRPNDRNYPRGKAPPTQWAAALHYVKKTFPAGNNPRRCLPLPLSSTRGPRTARASTAAKAYAIRPPIDQAKHERRPPSRPLTSKASASHVSTSKKSQSLARS